MRRFGFVLVLVVLAPLGLPMAAQQRATVLGPPESSLRAVQEGAEASAWHAVGRLDTGVSFCTATLIAPDLVLTAAHCLFTDAGARLPDAGLRFSAGLRHGRAEAIRGVSQSFLPRGYARPVGRADMAAISQDIALLRLDRAVSVTAVRPMAAMGLAAPGDAVTLVSYGIDRESFPSIEENCRILSQEAVTQVLSCQVVAGSSGAPVVVSGPDGPRIVAVVSGRAELAGDEVTVAVAADVVAPALTAASLPGPPAAARVSQSGGVTLRRVDLGQAARDGMGARFVRP